MAAKFSTNPATGSGSVQITLPVSPGRAGFAPSLALSYDSASGNGLFGFGWSLSLPRIARRTAKGVPLYDDSDVFVLSGAEDLVPVLDPDDCPVEPDLHPDFIIQRYMPRVRYGNVTSALIDPDLSRAEWLFEVVLDYDDHLSGAHSHEGRGSACASAVPARDWPVRPDPFSDCRAGYELRTQRRCKRVLMFHSFQELGPGPYLVASTDFDYRDGEEHGSGPAGSFLMAVSQSGYIRQPDGSYHSESLPPTEFGYSRAHLSDEAGTLDSASLENLPAGLGANIHWVDLDGDGLPGMLLRTTGAWLYKPNLGGGGVRTGANPA
ncbi:SpvB/TcaC N-terminal domain-containing protein [Paracoccus xiamenensis]|uniref:SpvB/TcaC N-terminal domain-containing protein n=1 Tax=Paracoccus xiamenensis TaxID=2714901 RepID=UPI001408D822|nr:SpvB/TcaC N-terminal domain-containing protein [Paracoccus xiamenensis]NHF73487.1 hypothetical protein [Paracoccus xiamenensis]